MTAYAPERTDRVVDTGLCFGPGDPVRIRVVHRDRRILVSDAGAAVYRVGRSRLWKRAARRIADEFVVNISRSGVVWLPVVRVGPSEEEIVRRIAEASLALYQEALDLVD